MADNFSLTGSYSSVPFSPADSADFEVLSQIEEKLVLSSKVAAGIDLAADGPQSIVITPLTEVNVLVLKVTSGMKVDAAISSVDGSLQVIPVDGLLFLITQDTPITAIALTRTPGVDTNVRVFLGQTQ